MGDSPIISRETLMALLSKERLVDIVLLQADRIARLGDTIVRLEKRIEELETRSKANSSNSNQPPSSDSPYKQPGKKVSRAPRKDTRDTGSRCYLLRKSSPYHLRPANADAAAYGEHKPLYIHQRIELPEIKPEVTHFVLLKGACASCGKINKARVPSEYHNGYGPRMSAVIAELAGSHGDSRSTIQNFCASVLGFSISVGAIQKVLDRSSEAIKALIKDWAGILASDGYRLYTNWVGLRQTCLAHLIREAKRPSESKDAEIAGFGANALVELRRLCHMAHAPPTLGKRLAFYARFKNSLPCIMGEKTMPENSW